MADMAAMYGLVGALGGALIGSSSTLIGTWLSHRNDADREEKAQATEKQQQLTRLRTAGREWQETLERAYQQLDMGSTVSLERFDDAIQGHSKETTEAAYAPHAGPMIGSRDLGSSALPPLPDPIEAGALADEIRSRLLGGLRETTKTMREHILWLTANPEAGGGYRMQQLMEDLLAVRRTRAQYNNYLIEQESNLSRTADTPD
ncbi:hypothetical protein [Streptomyces sp. NBC_01373]|uniref:hypothetical protein n=1 Tax=Streptomyces sp. NBC_01373 TaxID=2903843 RepID=UPI002251BA8C|nr:hypothetical protein [Streptomyces sp. NBC_01373]MCX4706811.1 hypothetical protein [Streptomyces sp. NBC_01373]